jgi:ribosomal protein L37AE/L43A
MENKDKLIEQMMNEDFEVEIKRPEMVVRAFDKLTKREEKYLVEYFDNIKREALVRMKEKLTTSLQEQTASAKNRSAKKLETVEHAHNDEEYDNKGHFYAQVKGDYSSPKHCMNCMSNEFIEVNEGWMCKDCCAIIMGSDFYQGRNSMKAELKRQITKLEAENARHLVVSLENATLKDARNANTLVITFYARKPLRKLRV